MCHFLVQRKYVNSVLTLRMYFFVFKSVGEIAFSQWMVADYM